MEPLWIRAAVATVGLVDDDSSVLRAALPPESAAWFERAHERVRASGDRRAVARAIVAEALAARFERAPDPTPDVGAHFLARWMVGLSREQRAPVARTFSPEVREAVTRVARGAEAYDPRTQVLASWLVGTAHRSAGAFFTASDWTAFFATLLGHATRASRPVLELERRVRILGRDAELRTLGAALWR